MVKHAWLTLAAVFVAGSASTLSAQVTTRGIPNSQKYRNAGIKPATGRSGSVTLEARVLIGKQGSMTVEASANGTITKAQIKAGGVTQNHNGLDAGGYFVTALPAAVRGTSVRVQANISGADPNRIGVVTVSTPAVLRPDIAVRGVTGPTEHAPGAPVTFVAIVEEKNGDVGANADCTLSVNGTIIGAARSIWVDAGGTVSCRFTHTFAAPGTYAISASAANVVPGDWDSSNNSASTTVAIAEPGTQITNGSIDVEQRNTTERYLEYRPGEYSLDRIQTHNYSFVTMNGTMATGTAPVHTVNVDIFADGHLQHHASLAPQWWTTIEFPGFRGVCGHYNAEVWDGTQWVNARDIFSACSYIVGGGTEPTHSQFFYQQLAGDIVYNGSDTFCDGSACNTYHWIDRQSYGGVEDFRWAAGTAVRLKVDFVDTNGAIAFVDRTVTLADASAEVNRESSGVWPDAEYGDVLWEQRLWGVLFRGVVTW